MCLSIDDSATSRLRVCHIFLGGYQKYINMLKRVCVEESIKGMGKKKRSVKHLQKNERRLASSRDKGAIKIHRNLKDSSIKAKKQWISVPLFNSEEEDLFKKKEICD